MVALDNAAISLRLAGFDNLAFVIGIIELKTVLGEQTNSRSSKMCCNEIIRFNHTINTGTEKKKTLDCDFKGRSVMMQYSQVSWALQPL